MLSFLSHIHLLMTNPNVLSLQQKLRDLPHNTFGGGCILDSSEIYFYLHYYNLDIVAHVLAVRTSASLLVKMISIEALFRQCYKTALGSKPACWERPEPRAPHMPAGPAPLTPLLLQQGQVEVLKPWTTV